MTYLWLSYCIQSINNAKFDNIVKIQSDIDKEKLYILSISLYLRGPRGVPDMRIVKIEFYVVCDRKEPHLPDAFYWIKKYCS